MKNKKGFTLVELLSVVAILVILALIITPVIDKNIKRSKEKMYRIQIENIRMAGENYFTDNIDRKPTINGNYSHVGVHTLIEKGYIEDNIKNPKTGQEFEDELYVQLKNVEGTFVYSVCPLEDGCEEFTDPFESVQSFIKVRDINPTVICGDGLEEDYENSDVCYIYSTEDLIEFAKMVNSGLNFANKTVMLMNNLNVVDAKSYVDPTTTFFGDVNGDGNTSSLLEELSMQSTKAFPVIGDNTNYFSGTFEGNARIIAGIYINCPSSQYVALFGYNSGTIRGLIIKDAVVRGDYFSGILVGINVGTIKNVQVEGNLTGYHRVGLIAGENSGSISGIAKGNVTATSGNSYAGGIVGHSASNSSTVNAVYQGGIITGYDNTYKAVGYISAGTNNIITAASSTVNGNAYTNTDITSRAGYTVPDSGIKNIGVYESVLDTFIGGDSDSDGYYYDYNAEGDIELYNTTYNPLTISLRGSGTAERPYIINSYDDLKQASYNPTKHYRLNADINMEGKNQIILASDDNPFTGSFEGNNHTINNLTMIGHNYTALFGANQGTVSDLSLSNVTLSGFSYSGVIAGSSSGTINNIHVSGIMSGYNYSGGAVGSNTGTMNGIWVNGNMTGYNYSGLLSGSNSGTINNVQATGNLTANHRIGLLAGENSGSIKGIAKGNVTATSSNSYAGGIVGCTTGGSSTINAVYQGGTIIGYDNTYKAVGYQSSGTNNIITAASATVNGNAHTNTDINSATGYTVSDRAIGSIIPYESILDTSVGMDNNGDGYYYDDDGLGNVNLYKLSERPLSITMSGSGTVDSPYVINNYGDLKQASYDPTKNYVLNSNIDLTNEIPITLSSNSNPFTGSFNGGNHTLSNAYLVGHNYSSLFGNNSGTISDLTLSSATLSGHDYSGTIVGLNSGTVSNIHISGTMSGYNYSGGAVGSNTGTMNGIWVNGNMTGYNYSGLLSGSNSGTINNVQATGNLTAIHRIGLLAGENSGSIKGIAKGNVTATSSNSYAGGIVGCTTGGSSTINAVYQGGTIIGYDNTYKAVGYQSSGTNNIITAASATVNGNAYTSTDINSATGYTVSDRAIGSVIPYESILDTSVGMDNNGDGYYYDDDGLGNVYLYKLSERPLSITMSGSGTVGSPYVINNYSDLKQASYDPTKNYVLNSNIDLTNEIPITLSSNSNPFTGSFNGGNYTLSNAYLVGHNYSSLFGNNSGTISDLTLSSATLSGHDYSGTIVGLNSGTVSNIHISGTMSGYNYSGGAVGSNTGTMNGIWVNGNMTGYYYSGLLSGLNSGTINNVQATGNLTANHRIGLLAGENSGSLTGIAKGNVTATNSNSYAGGIVGCTTGGSSTINAVYQGGTITGYDNTYKAVGYQSSGTNNIITAASATVNGNAYTSTDINSATGYTVSDRAIGSIIPYESILDTSVGMDNNGDGYYYDDDGLGNVYLYKLSERPLSITMSGSGTVGSPYVINNYSDLKQASYDPTKNYVLNSNIDLTNEIPITLSSNSNPFTGSFNGGNHTLSNAYLVGHNYSSLFGNNSGTISDLTLSSATLSGHDYSGTIVGLNSGTVSNIHISGTMSGYNYSGGAVGSNTGTMNGIWVNGNMTGYYYSGLLSGSNSGIINNVQVDGNLTANHRIGLLAGENSGSLTGIAKGNVTATNSNSYAGGIVGCTTGGSSTVTAVYQGGTITGYDNTYKAVGYISSGTNNIITAASATVNGNAYTSTDLTSRTGYTYSDADLLTSSPYESLGFNFTVTDPNVKEYIWRFNNSVLTMEKN